jgi:hypothetical protein
MVRNSIRFPRVSLERRQLMLNGLTRSLATLLGAAAAGLLLWLAAQVGRHSTGGYWAAYGIVAGAGLIFALSQSRRGNGQRGRTEQPRGMFLIGFLPVLVVAGWVLLGGQPHSNWFRSHVLAWSGDMHIRSAVQDIGTWVGVLAFGIGYTFGAVFEPASRRAAVVAEPVPPAHEPIVADEPVMADEPVAAERREVSQPADEAVPVP